jgi:hypothetical protein
MTEEVSERAGLTRRSLIKKSAIVGGTAVWAAPVVQSITHKALAQGGSPPPLNGEISHFTLVLTNGIDTWWAKYDGPGSTCDEGFNEGECRPDPNLFGPTQQGCPPPESHSVEPSGTNDVLVTVNSGWTLVYFRVKDGDDPPDNGCYDPGETSIHGVTQPSLPGGGLVGPGTITILDPKPI